MITLEDWALIRRLAALRGLAAALDDLVSTARAGRTTAAQMSAGTVTITNIGALGVDAGTPILNPGESVILASVKSGRSRGSATGPSLSVR